MTPKITGENMYHLQYSLDKADAFPSTAVRFYPSQERFFFVSAH